MSALPADRHSQTLARHSWTRSERVSYTPIAHWWMFCVDLGRWSKCFSWEIG